MTLVPGPRRDRATLAADLRASHARSAALMAQSAEVLRASRDLRAQARRGRDVARVHRMSAGDFRLRGTVSGEPVEALWLGAAMQASEALLARAEVVVALGDVLADGRPAALSDATAALLTLVRACDRVTSVELSTRRRRDPSRTG